MNKIQYIDTPDQLEELRSKIAQEPWIAIDTEFMREKTYYPQFCLMQIATPEWVACVDPMVLPDLDCLFDVIYNPSILKVFHACRQDMEILYHLTGKVPEPVFDTQLAAPLLGFQENPGYGMLVSSFLNINLSKAHTRTDWSIRPLHEDQLKYAADDVIYLGKIYQLIRTKLIELGRLDWLQDDFACLANTDLYLPPPEKAWLRIKGKNKLTGKQLSIVQALASWRERTAQSEDRPRNWLLRDDIIVDLARLQPATISKLFKVRSMNERTAKRYGETICRLISDAILSPPVKLKKNGRLPKKLQEQEAVLDVLTALVRVRADENSLNPAILATRKDLEMLLMEDPKCRLLHGWRQSMVGKELIDVLKGKFMVSLKNSQLQLLENTPPQLAG